MKHRQLNLFANKKEWRELNRRLREEARAIMERRKPGPERKARKEPGCGTWA